ncbi:hypothetical protein F5Y16DRAFT_400241 [Xylariaceae sp. FL0255]|nr:hypothetical protein F5Y16DRAFT_400241 [Xylariaceae sp. FL0255]
MPLKLQEHGSWGEPGAHGLGKEHDGDSNVLINGIKNETLRAHADEKTHSSTISSKPSRNPQRVSNSNAISIAGNYTSDPEQPSTTIVSSSLFTTLPPPNNTSAAPKIPNTSAITTIVMDTWITLAPTLTLLPPPEFIVVTPSTFQKSTLTPVPTTMTTTTQASSSSCESRPSHFITLSVIPSNSSLQNQPTEASDYPSPSHLASIEIGFIVFGLVISTLLFSASYAFYGWRRRRLSRQRELNGKNHDAWHGESAACQEGVVALGGHDGLPPELYVPRLGLDKPAELDGLRPLAELAATTDTATQLDSKAQKNLIKALSTTSTLSPYEQAARHFKSVVPEITTDDDSDPIEPSNATGPPPVSLVTLAGIGTGTGAAVFVIVAWYVLYRCYKTKSSLSRCLGLRNQRDMKIVEPEAEKGIACEKKHFTAACSSWNWQPG